MVKEKVRINADWQVKRSKCPAAVGELAPSKESWPLLLLLHTSTNVSLQAAAQQWRLLDQMTLPGLSDDSGHCPPLLPQCTTVERSITVKKSTTVEKSTCGEKLSGNSGHWPPLSVWSTCLSAHILHYSNTTTVSIKGVSELKDC